MTTSRECAELRTYLRQLADMIEHPTAAQVATRVRIANRLHELADRNLAVLPAINPQRDNLGHWLGIDDQQLRSENGADAWNLAAGLYVQHDRAIDADRRLADDAARFAANCPKDAS